MKRELKKGLLLFLGMCQENDLPLQIRLPHQSLFDAPLSGRVVRLLDGRYAIVRVEQLLGGAMRVQRTVFDPCDIMELQWLSGANITAPNIIVRDYDRDMRYYG